MSTLYIHPETGELLENPVAWAIPIADVDRGVRAPLIVRCEIHGRFEAHGSVVNAVHLQRSRHTVRDLASCLLAAVSGSCRTYRRWKAQVLERYQTLETAPVAQQPLISYLLLADSIAQCTNHPDALAALAAMPIPTLPGPEHPIGRAAVLDRATGAIAFIAPPGAAATIARGAALPRGQQWLLARCREHGWERFDRLGAHDQRTYEILHYYAHAVIAGSARGCDDFTARMRLFTIGELPTRAERPLDALAYYQAFALALHHVTADTAWVVGELLDKLTHRNP